MNLNFVHKLTNQSTNNVQIYLIRFMNLIYQNCDIVHKLIVDTLFKSPSFSQIPTKIAALNISRGLLEQRVGVSLLYRLEDGSKIVRIPTITSSKTHFRSHYPLNLFVCIPMLLYVLHF